MRILALVVIGGAIAALVATRQRRLQWRKERRQAQVDFRRARRGEAPAETPTRLSHERAALGSARIA